ncbi:hypothetical protein Aasi_1440 [Candidatus Amoebophilus asiaticus 5a2]|uniref:Type I restriction enzyme R protein N-terminal domain-containing protein n=1 Tax=Amoebophilus asiaticus (strain 5a2) TaxID=452471 RepID=B3EU28_AMOA5|nr:type I restriction enzyme HsdR N-terminal domain-containing protein [Candidatus Amoebophilus asiaticus]ACE06730.1 hypothetical protein Aasi_1440 [Candidatus Amoebophilus asiaticus 5a2]
MQFINFSTFNYKVRTIADKHYIFDIIRKKYVRLTPEEWTRQHLVHYLTQELSYPKGLIRIEKQIQGHYIVNRPDLVIYDRIGNPFLIAECKASHIPISDKVYSQLARYNRNLKAKLLVISNGQEYGCWKMSYDGLGHEILDTIPVFDSLV